MLGGYGFLGQVKAGDGSDKQGKMGAGYANFTRRKKKQQLCDNQSLLKAVNGWIGEGGKAML